MAYNLLPYPPRSLSSVWVAHKIPAGHVSSHANQARITTFDWNDPSTAMYSHDVLSFAKKIGLVPPDQLANTFSFSDTYDPVTFEGARFCEGRVWSFFSTVMGPEFEDEFADYASGKNLTNRMPLFVKPLEKVRRCVNYVMNNGLLCPTNQYLYEEERDVEQSYESNI